MQVYKFGGASVASVERIIQAANIIEKSLGSPLLVVVSAMGKTTNALEGVVQAWFEGQQELALQRFEDIKKLHQQTASKLLSKNLKSAEDHLLNFYTEVEWLLHDKPVREFDYYYDQIVCTGELLSSSLLYFYLLERGIKAQWLDVRDVLRTDNHYREGNIDFSISKNLAEQHLRPLLQQQSVTIVQGFIGATDDNESTTLGREGSDYTAAVFAHLLDGEALTIWKDVEGVMNADPKVFPEAVIMPELNYREVIEMAYYGAQVIHPKTIKPLENKGIPFYVKCFLQPTLPGTIIRKQPLGKLPPVIIQKHQQVLMWLKSRDFSFVGEEPLAAFYQLLGKHQLKPNLTQNGAIQFLCCMDDTGEKLDALAHDAAAWFDVSMEKNLELLTIRHYTQEKMEELSANRVVVLKQQSEENVQILFRPKAL